MDVLSGREIIFEFKSSGGFGQVCAVDCATGIEVFVTTPAHAARHDQQSIALRKLAKALEAQGVISNPPTAQEKGDVPVGASPSPKRGLIV